MSNRPIINNSAIPNSLNNVSKPVETLILGRGNNKFVLNCQDEFSNITSTKPLKINNIDIINDLNTVKEDNKKCVSLQNDFNLLKNDYNNLKDEHKKLSDLVLKLSVIINNSFGLN